MRYLTTFATVTILALIAQTASAAASKEENIGVGSGAVVGALAGPIKEAVTAAIEKIDWPDKECGPPVEERQKQIAALDKTIEKLESELTELREAAHRETRI